MKAWQRDSDERARRAELEVIAQAATGDVKDAVAEVVNEVAHERSDQDRRALTSYMLQVPLRSAGRSDAPPTRRDARCRRGSPSRPPKTSPPCSPAASPGSSLGITRLRAWTANSSNSSVSAGSERSGRRSTRTDRAWHPWR